MNSYFEEKTGKEFGWPFGQKAIKAGIPLSGSLELTMHCNLHCRHCYLPEPEDKKELSTDEIVDIFKELVSEGCLWLLITGGEPLIRDDFTNIYLPAKKMGLLVTIFTNGTLITEDLAGFLSDYPPSSVEITLYGSTKETYESITQVSGSYNRCLKGIELLRKKGLSLSLKTMVMTLNRHELAAMKEVARNLGLGFRYDAELNPGLDGHKAPCKLRLSPEEVVKLDSEDEKRLKDLKKFYAESLTSSGFENLYICSAAKTYFHIDAYGNLCGCLMARSPRYNLKENSFKDAWKQLQSGLAQKKPGPDYRCGHCRLFSLCGQCPGWAEMENKDEEKPIEYLCEITHQRAKLLETNEVMGR